MLLAFGAIIIAVVVGCVFRIGSIWSRIEDDERISR